MKSLLPAARFVGGVAVVSLVALAAQLAPAAGRVAVASLERAVGHGLSGSVSYTEVNPGQDQGGSTLGVVGRGTFSGKAKTTAAAVAAKVVSVIKGIPVGSMLAGGTYVTRYDIDAQGTYHGVVVGRFKASALGSMCVSYVTTHGKFEAGSSFIPTKVAFSVVGGTGQGARARGSGTVTITNVTGSDVENLFGSGAIQTVSLGSPRPLNATCQAVAKLR